MEYNTCFIIPDEQLRQGAFLLYALFGIYSFTLLAIVCNDYFIPCVELICEDLNIPQVLLTKLKYCFSIGAGVLRGILPLHAKLGVNLNISILF